MRNHSSLFLLLFILFPALFSACNEEEKQIPPPEIYLAGETTEIEISVGDTITLEPKITYNVDGKYEWRKNDELLSITEPFLRDTATSLGHIEYFFSVVTPYGADSMIIPVDVIVLADFTKLFPENLQTDSSWVGSPDADGFSYSNMFFPIHFEETDSSWRGFGYSNIQSTSQDEEAMPQNSVYSTSSSENVFSVVKHPNGTDSAPPTLYFEDNQNHRLKSIQINNTTWGVFLLKYGNENFDRMGYPVSTDPDWFKVTMTGINAAGAITGRQDFFLADYRFDNKKRDYIVDSWTETDLSALGEINRLQFSLSSNKTNAEGEMITPEEFCIDNIKVLN